ncbi:HAD-IIA family hydrolase [Nonomuraea endophytica]|uniref:HAD superfamily hydrolase (TIGR01457 family) n=1 Tax=Nonomuraea endophytica TaxID=714136 RepID=A0A7W8EM35_9ACTN|nr:HAD-IIA family hydrolase [Nonomuraea endophytica]MBB5084251.1 HAD superfamily hydrolase (TIGR01457 family) [Nonomuraea endophytica]
MLVERYDTLLLDLDGVVYLGARAVPGAAESLVAAKGRGARLAYVTNNASRTPAAIAGHLRELGVPAEREDVVTSAQAAARLIAERFEPGARVLVVGGTGLRLAVRDQGLRVVTTAMDQPVAVVQGIAAGLSYGLLAEGALAVRQGALFVASNGDSTMPSGRGVLPGNGAMVRVIATATGVEPVYAGKPAPPLHRESMLRTGAERPLVVGDRLDTDIEGARNAGVDSLLVLTGVAGPLDVLTAAPEHRPTYVAEDLRALGEDYPEVRRGWRATWVDGSLRLEGDGTWIEGLRTACEAAWEAAGAGRVDEDSVKPVLERLQAG